MKVLIEEISRFVNEAWPDGYYQDDCGPAWEAHFTENGEAPRIPGELVELEDFECSLVWKGKGPDPYWDGLCFTDQFLKWRKSLTTVIISAEVPREKEAAVRQVAFGHAVLQEAQASVLATEEITEMISLASVEAFVADCSEMQLLARLVEMRIRGESDLSIALRRAHATFVDRQPIVAALEEAVRGHGKRFQKDRLQCGHNRRIIALKCPGQNQTIQSSG